MIALEPRPRPLKPKAKRFPARKWMTLVAGFRCRNGGVLLCSDREEIAGDFKRPVDKIYRIYGLSQAHVFIAGAGPTAIIAKACEAIHEAMIEASESGKDLWSEHRNLIESALSLVYEKYVINQTDARIGLVIVFASTGEGRAPLLYKTADAMLVSTPLYASHGAGAVIADYLSDRIYKHGMPKSLLAVLAAFIFREAEDSTVGVGGMDMQFIFDGDRSIQSVGWDEIKELKDKIIPRLQDAILGYWQDNLTLPAKFVEDLDGPMPSTSHTSGDQP
jgi:hypothetical protein